MSKIIKNTSLYSIGNILPQAAGFILLPIYTRYLTPTDYGIISSMQVLSTVLALFFTLAIERSIFRLYFDYKTEKDRKDYLGTISITLYLISVGVLCLLFLFREYVGKIYVSINFHPFYVYAIFTAFLTVFAIIPKIYFQIKERAEAFILISLSQFLLSTGFVLWFIIGKQEGAVGMLKGRLVANIVVLPFFIIVAFKTINFTFKRKVLKESLSFSLPMIPGLLSAWILNLSDRIFIERYFNLHDVGIYSLGYKIAGLVLIFSGAFNKAYNPVFYKLANSEDQASAKNNLYKYNQAYVIAILTIVFLISLFSKELIVLLLDSKFIEAYKIVPIIAFAYFLSQISGLFNLMIYQEKKVIFLMYVGLAGAGLNILLNFLLVPSLGAWGAAYATVISFLVVLILSGIYAKKCYYIPINIKLVFIVFSLLLAFTTIFHIINIESVLISLIIKTTVLTIVCLLLYIKYKDKINLLYLKFKFKRA